jgi:hypothetical protein
VNQNSIKQPPRPRIRNLVRKERLELSRVTPLVPKTSASTSSATFASSPGSFPGTGSIIAFLNYIKELRLNYPFARYGGNTLGRHYTGSRASPDGLRKQGAGKTKKTRGMVGRAGSTPCDGRADKADFCSCKICTSAIPGVGCRPWAFRCSTKRNRNADRRFESGTQLSGSLDC